MIIGIGTDIIEIDRMKEALQTNLRLSERLFTSGELDYCQQKCNSFESFAARFAAKEAMTKALGTGFRNYNWTDIEVVKDDLGKPSINLKGNALMKAEELGVTHIHLSLSHGKDYATAMVVLEGS
ncbi:holo-[acyl-carrier-protein] synthase [Desulfonispora thiosulfatigenes DSM 11270]|uniref:Holo-[acyl-carrier-protein] synthase n=1 Tax=Desulfonispora thiosulfatigenes DSM 11270 TaxID=656914 RepID=A0A1W1V938_DESTI|nr:holo-ACP synthase [Desulfonispora thiosulfatigenes]SMB89571.1 holo-[acyl-carrier-protein] synthase [Desulfonispora thiosulfatigenes DSM 11270]